MRSTVEVRSFRVPGPYGGKLIRKVVQVFKKYELKLAPEQRIGVAVSGGVDSLALFTLLARHGKRLLAPSQLVLIHLDHGWSEGSDQAGLLLQSLAQKEGSDWILEKLGPHLKKGASPEAQASIARRRRLLEIKKREKLRLLLTAHHLDDLFETLLMQFLKGEPNLYENAGIYEFSDPWLRPLLSVPKTSLIAFLKEEEVWPIEDPTQKNINLVRNRLRARVTPEIFEAFPGARAAVTAPWFEPRLRERLPANELSRKLLLLGVRPSRATWQALSRLPVGKALQVSKEWSVKRLDSFCWQVCSRDSQHASLES